MSIQNNLSQHYNNHGGGGNENGGKNHHHHHNNQQQQQQPLSIITTSNDLDKSSSMKNGHQTTTTAASTTTTTTNHQPNGDFRMLPIIEQSSQISNGNGNGKQPRNSIHSMTNSQKSNLLNRTKKFLKGICLTILSGLFFSITTLVVKYVKDVSPGTTAGFRYFGKQIFNYLF